MGRKQLLVILAFVSLWLTLSFPSVGAAPKPSKAFQQLRQALVSNGVEVVLAPTPVRGSYGVYDAKARKIWVHPITFDLNIADPTLIHEAVHAAQGCAGKGEPQALGLEISAPAQARPFFMPYQHPYRRQIEAEAFAVQAAPDGFGRAIALVQKHC